MTNDWSNNLLLKMLSFFAIVGVAGSLFFFTPLGLGTTPDSIAYLKGARGLLSGHGWTYMSGQWPPLYPSLIAAVSELLRQDVLVGARALQSLLFALNFWLIAITLRTFCNVPYLLSLTLAGLLCLHPVMTHIHFYAWSEPLFILLILINFQLLRKITATRLDLRLCLLLSFIAGCAILTRFVGVVVLIANCLVLYAMSRDALSRKLLVSIVLPLAVAGFLYIPWVGHTAVSDGAAVERWISFNPLPLETISKAIATVGTWWFPSSGIQYSPKQSLLLLSLGWLCLCLPTIAIAGCRTLVVSVLRGDLQTNSNRSIVQLLFLMLFVYGYIGFVLLAWMLIDNKVHLDNRMWAPLFVLLFILLIKIVFNIKNKISHIVCLGLLLLLLGSAYDSARGVALMSRYNGLELSSKSVAAKPLQQFVAGCSGATVIVADQPWNFDLYVSTKVLWLPARVLYYKGIPNSGYNAQLVALSGTADLIILESKAQETIRDVDAIAGFSRVYEDQDAVVWYNTSLTKDYPCQR